MTSQWVMPAPCESLVEHYRQNRFPSATATGFLVVLQDDDGCRRQAREGKEIRKAARRRVEPLRRPVGIPGPPRPVSKRLAAFQKSIDLPLITHNRWIDPASPYHEHYKISGIAAVDPKWWDHIAAY